MELRTKNYNIKKADEIKVSWLAARRSSTADIAFVKHFNDNTDQRKIADLFQYLLSKRDSASITDEQVAHIIDCSVNWVYKVRCKLIVMGLIQHLRNTGKKIRSFCKFIYKRLKALNEWVKIQIAAGWRVPFIPNINLRSKNESQAPPDAKQSEAPTELVEWFKD